MKRDLIEKEKELQQLLHNRSLLSTDVKEKIHEIKDQENQVQQIHLLHSSQGIGQFYYRGASYIADEQKLLFYSVVT